MSEAESLGSDVTSFDALHERLSAFRDGWIFRGLSNATWKLVPKAGRPDFKGNDQTLFESWKLKAIEYLSIRPDSDWDWLAIAQHHGLATRLLDWTTNPLNAAYFAVRELAHVPRKSAQGPAVIHAAKFDTKYSQSADKQPGNPDPMSPSPPGPGILIFRPSCVVPRITRQDGLFTIHNPPCSPLEELQGVVELQRIVIGEGYRARLLSELAFYGVTSASLFPDLDGLSTFLNWWWHESAGAATP